MTVCPITHAKAYPFEIPETSYVLDRSGWRPLKGAYDTHGRTAVVASGSNASPHRLATKYADHPDLLDATILVTRALLHEFDTVYSAHISSYGSIPATLAHVPGAVADVFVTWLTDAQLHRMHETEAVGMNYDFVKLSGILLLCEGQEEVTSAHAYISRRGCLNLHGNPIPLAATRTEGRQGIAMTQDEVLDFVRAKLTPSESLESFIRKQIECTRTRSQRTNALAANALPHGWARVERDICSLVKPS